MNGIICIYKEKGMTSFDVVAKVRRIYKTKKVGHGGTLDPMAEGVLPVFVGDATKAVDFCPDDTKQYVAGFQFGITTDTQDITGKVLSTCDAYVSRNKMPMIERVFTGEQLQTPPMYSAVKVNGQRLYDLARKGEVVSRQPRKINIYELKVQKYEYNSGEMSVTCSKGTYIRTLIHDIGQKLETGAVMTSLIRVRSGVFTLDYCYRLRELEEKSAEELESLLLPLEKLYGQLPKARLDEKQTKLFRNGASLDADRIRFDIIYDKGYYIEGSDGVFLGLGKIGTNHELEVLRRFNTDSTNIMKPAPAGNNYANIKTAAEKKAEKVKESFNTKADTDSDSAITGETGEKTAGIGEEAANIFVEAAAETIEEAAETPVEIVTETVVEEAEAPVETAAETFEEVIETPAETVTETVEEEVEAPAETTAETVEEEVDSPVEAVAETVEEVIETPAETVTETVEEVTEALAEDVSETIKEEVEPPVEAVAETVEKVIETPAESVTEIVEEEVEAPAETAAETVEEEVDSPVEAVAETVEEVIETPAETVTETVEEVTEALAEDVSETIKEEVEPPVEAVAETVEKVIETPAESVTEIVEEEVEAPAETAAETVEEEVDSPVEAVAETVEEVIETPAETVTETVEEVTEALAEDVSETIKEEVEPPVEAVAETVEKVIETPAETAAETVEEEIEAPAEIVTETVEQEAEKPIETVTETVDEATEFLSETETVSQKNITPESHEESEQYDDYLYIPTLGYESDVKDGEDSIVAQALANIKAANGEFSEAEPDGAEDNGGKEVDIVQQAVARVTFDSELENIFSDVSSLEGAKENQSESANRQEQTREQERNSESESETDVSDGGEESRINIDNDYLAYLESAFIDDEEEFFDGERTDGI